MQINAKQRYEIAVRAKYTKTWCTIAVHANMYLLVYQNEQKKFSKLRISCYLKNGEKFISLKIPKFDRFLVRMTKEIDLR